MEKITARIREDADREIAQMNQETDRLQWGAGRIMHHENLFALVSSLKKKAEEGCRDFSPELAALRKVEASQNACYVDDISYMIHGTEKVMQILMKIEEDK